ncbi:carbohydrate ABC transporter permease [Fodinisporobacter ferrooxydans]|uniref:Carbohydrate ABC transporter permease n=1 Tax=Fodinisporobacter ferrooxydans TaxID=2901836 RepID=A0ABY4CHT5_9BACL|nr:carbohydrate ABC transporter permease [Alicyclobacillaceae bacterium MYW30-H2]
MGPSQMLRKFIVTVLAVFWLIVALYPILYLLFESFRSQETYLTGLPWLPPKHLYFGNYQSVLSQGFGIYFLNSTIVALVSLVMIIIFGMMASYAIVRLKGWVSSKVFMLFLAGLAIPIQAAIIPLYLLIFRLGLYDTLWAMILPSVAFALPLSILILVNFLRDIPKELYEAMMMEGIGTLGLLWRLAFPLSKPALTAVGIFNFVQIWNNFLFPLVLTNNPNLQTLPLALQHFQGQYTMNVPAIMAAVTLSAIPLIIAYIFGRRQLLAGMTAGFSK